MQQWSSPLTDLWRDGWAFEDRDDAARRLARLLSRGEWEDPVVLGIPRGGVPIAARVALEMRAPLDVLVVRRLSVPARPKAAMGAIGEGGVRIVDRGQVAAHGVRPEEIAVAEHRERAVLRTRAQRWRGGRPPLDLTGRTALIVDDGISSGATASAACQVAREQGAERVVIAVPVGDSRRIDAIRGLDDIVCLLQPRDFRAIGDYYRHFEPISDDDVATLLALSRPLTKPQAQRS